MLYENKFFEDAYSVYWNYKNTYPMHLHEKVEVIYFLKGSLTATVGNKKYECREGDLLIIFPYEPHCYESASDDEINVAMGIPIAMLAGYGINLFAIKPESHLIKNSERKIKRLNLLVDALETYRNNYWETVGALHFSCAFFGEAIKGVNLVPRFKNEMKTGEKILVTCTENFLDSTFTIAALSEKTGISERSISRFFSGNLETSFPKFISMMRVSHATELMEQKGYTITKAALESGFGSVRSFNRAFKLEKNVTPSEYFGKKK